MVSDMGKRYRAVQSFVVVTPPGGGSYRQDIVLVHDRKLNTFNIVPMDGHLKDYQIDTPVSELVRARDQGVEVDEIPKV